MKNVDLPGFRAFIALALVLSASGLATGQTRESPYETIVRLKRQAAAKESQSTPPSESAGQLVARAELKLVPPFQSCPATALGFQRQDTTTVRPPTIRETPSGAPREPVYFPVRVGGREIQGITYRSTRPPGDVMLILDLDGDGLWSDEKVYIGRRNQLLTYCASYEFGPVYLKQGRSEPGGDAFYPQCTDGKWLTFYPAFYRDGTVVLEGKTRRVTLVDTDFDGRFNRMFDPPGRGSRDPNCDVISFDCDELVDVPGGGRRSVAVTMPLSKVIKFEGRYYGVEVPEDGSVIEFRRAEPAFGTLDFGGKEVAAEFWSDAGPQDVNGVEPTWRLPAGRYYVKSLGLTETEGGNRWAFTMTKPGGLGDFEIKAGEKTRLQIGPPFQVRGSMGRYFYNPDATVRLELEGRAGERYAGVVKKNGREVPEPSFQILDQAGTVVRSGKFAYG